MKNSTILFLLLFFSRTILASHIIGGSMTYENQGNDMYKIKLEVLRDCAGGGAGFDNPAYLGIYSGTALVETKELIFNGSSEMINNDLPNNICVFSEGVCFEKFVYETTANLPNVPAGYDLVYQRCCRSEIILNLNDPETYGMTFHTHINTSISNSSPTLINSTPLGIFAGTPFVYDASSIDPDGDSLVYRLVAPFAGGGVEGTSMNPGDPTGYGGVQPNPPASPPFTEIAFLEPYSVENMLGGNYPLNIHSETGQMSAVASSLGVFQIAYAIDEYRNEELIGTTYREFTFVVVPPASGQTYNIGGTIFVGGGIPLDEGKVQIMERDLGTDLLSVYAEQDVNMNGEYAFSNIPAGLFYVKGTPGENSIYVEDYLPTYYNSSAFWYAALPLNQCDTSDVYREIHLVPINNDFSGQRIFEGTVRQPSNDDQMVEVGGLDLILKDENNQFIQIRKTNASGYFKFEGLDNGNYFLYVDLINSNIYNEEPLLIELNEDLDADVYMYNTALSFSFFTGIESVKQEEYLVKIHSNPTGNLARLEMEINKGGNYNVKILDIYGRHQNTILRDEYLAEGIFNQDISMSKYASGVYFIVVEHEGNRIVKKIVKH